MNRLVAWVGVAISTIVILIATLEPAGTTLRPFFAFDLTSGDAAFAELIQNLLLFIPLGASLALAGVRPLWVIVLSGAALSFSVEFAQQYIPGRDPSVGDIVCNTVSTATGMALVIAAPRWLFTTPQRSARWALGVAIAAVLVWALTGILYRPAVPQGPYRTYFTPDFDFWGHYRGRVLAAKLGGVSLADSTPVAPDDPTPGASPGYPGSENLVQKQVLQVRVAASKKPPGRTSPLIAFVGPPPDSTKVLMFIADGTDLGVRYYTRAIEWTLEGPDLRWRHALARVAPQDTFVAELWRGEHGVCMTMNSARACGFGYTIGDGWKLIYYPEHFSTLLYGLLNMLWVAGWTIGVGWWAARAPRAVRLVAAAMVLVALLIVPVLTGLNATPIIEWIGALAGLGAGFGLARHPALQMERGSGGEDATAPPRSGIRAR